MAGSRRTRTEDYLAAIDRICIGGNAHRAATGAIASAVGVAKGTASDVLKSLAQQGLIDLLPYAGAQLTEAGTRRARRIVRRYRLLEMFLARTLEIPSERLAVEAWSLEPAASEDLMQHLDRFLQHPEFNPHGDPIPRADGSLPNRP
jgi:DtxR family Mn-dependent transcriptional regulator